MSTLERASCPLCSTDLGQECYQFPPYAVVRCQACKVHYLSPRLVEEEMATFYASEEYYAGDSGVGYDGYQTQELSLRKTFRKLLGQLKAHGSSGGEVLEVGCGGGFFLDEASSFFRERWATDYSEEFVAQARETGTLAFCGGIETLPEGQTFDTIVLIQVLEHIYHPIEFLAALRKKLRKGGAIAIAVPNMNSPLRWFMGHRWPSFKVPEHVTFFTQRSLQGCIQKAGFQDSQILPYPHAFPLSLLAEKFGLKLPESLGKVSVWIPTTTIARIARAT